MTILDKKRYLLCGENRELSKGNAPHYSCNSHFQKAAVRGKSIQESTHSADNFPPIISSGVYDEVNGYEHSFAVFSKNLFNINVGNHKGKCTAQVEDNKVHITNPVSTKTYIFAALPIPHGEKLIGENVTISADIENKSTNKCGLRLGYLKTNGNWQSGTDIHKYVNSGRVEATGEVKASADSTAILCLLFYYNTNGTYESGATITFNNIQVEIGDKATPWEEYIPQETFSVYTSEPLRSVGEVSDYLDLKRGILYRNIKSLPLRNTDAMGYGPLEYFSNTSGIFSLSLDYPAKSEEGMSNWFPVKSQYDETDIDAFADCIIIIDRKLYIIMKHSHAGTSDLINSDQARYLLQEYFDQKAAEGINFEVLYVMETEEESVSVPPIPKLSGVTNFIKYLSGISNGMSIVSVLEDEV